ncbi:hypothetical protein JST97_14700 [bacterium]|nr:hypothetical protein [bacterium]
MASPVQFEQLEDLLGYCLENKRRRREFIEAVRLLPPEGLSWLLFDGYRLALSGQTDQARQSFLQGFFQSQDPELRARFHWALVSLDRAYPRPADLDEMCQWLSGALHDGPAQSLALMGPREMAQELAELARWLRNPLLEGQSLAEALRDLLAPHRPLEISLEKAPAQLEQMFYRIFQEVAENRLPFSPCRVSLKVWARANYWLASWSDEKCQPCRLPTVQARAAQLAGQARYRANEQGFRLQVRCLRRSSLSYR